MQRQASNITALVLCLSLPLLLLLRAQLGSAAGHMDEYDYLFVGKTLLSGKDWPTHSYIFGWDLNWLLLAWGEVKLGGLFGARLVSASLGIISLAGMYAFVHTLWRSRAIALIAVMLLGFEAAHLYTSAIATYDIISFTAFIWSLPAIVLVCHCVQNKLLFTVLACTLICIAALSKYTVALYLPLIAVLMLWRAPLYAVIGALIISAVLGSYVLANLEQLQVLYDVQIRNAHAENARYTDVLIRIVTQLAALFVLSTLAIGYAALWHRQQLKLLAVLLAGALPLSVYHIYSHNVISLQKHLVYTSLFLIPIVSWWLHALFQHTKNTKTSSLFVVACVLCFALYNTHILNVMRASYPDMSQIALFANSMSGTETVLSEDPYLFRYTLIDITDQALIKETNWLDNNKDGIYEHRDVKQAVWARKFDYVFLNDQIHKRLNENLRKMLSYRNYHPVIDQRYELQTLSGQTRTGRISLYAKSAALAEVMP